MIRAMMETKEVLKRCRLMAAGIASDHDRAEDIMQQAFFELLESEHRYTESMECPDDFYREFRRLAENANNRTRYRHRREVVYWDRLAVNDDHTRLEMLDTVDHELTGAPKQVVFSLLDGLTVTEIAEELNVSHSYISQTKRKAMEVLRCTISTL